MRHHAIIINLPPKYKSVIYVDVSHEEEAVCWLWAYPEIFIWKNQISWLYTPVVGNKRWPGDLWGIDSEGNLLIIEAKRCHTNDDPFKDFEEYHTKNRTEFSADHWEKKWLRHYKAETDFADSVSVRPVHKTNGILPRSNKRKHIRLWRDLGEYIGNYIRTPAYRHQVIHNLNIRRNCNDPLPYYFALMIAHSKMRTVLTHKAKSSAIALAKMIGEDHVSVRVISCKRVNENKACIENSEYKF